MFGIGKLLDATLGSYQKHLRGGRREVGWATKKSEEPKSCENEKFRQKDKKP